MRRAGGGGEAPPGGGGEGGPEAGRAGGPAARGGGALAARGGGALAARRAASKRGAGAPRGGKAACSRGEGAPGGGRAPGTAQGGAGAQRGTGLLLPAAWIHGHFSAEANRVRGLVSGHYLPTPLGSGAGGRSHMRDVAEGGRGHQAEKLSWEDGGTGGAEEGQKRVASGSKAPACRSGCAPSRRRVKCIQCQNQQGTFPTSVCEAVACKFWRVYQCGENPRRSLVISGPALCFPRNLRI